MRTPPPPEMTFGFLIQLVFCEKKKTMMFIGVEVEKETSAPPPKTILDPPPQFLRWLKWRFRGKLVPSLIIN